MKWSKKIAIWIILFEFLNQGRKLELSETREAKMLGEWRGTQTMSLEEYFCQDKPFWKSLIIIRV